MQTVIVFWFSKTWGLREAVLGAMVTERTHVYNKRLTKSQPNQAARCECTFRHICYPGLSLGW